MHLHHRGALRRVLSLVALTTLPACGAGDESDATEQEDALRKRVTPTTSAAVLDVRRPAWLASDTKHDLFFDFAAAPVSFGRQEVPANGVRLFAKPWDDSGSDRAWPVRPGYFVTEAPSVLVATSAGAVTTYEPAGVSIRYERPVVGGANRLSLVQVAAGSAGGNAILGLGSMSLAVGFRRTLLGGRYRLVTDAESDPAAPRTLTFAQGQMREIVLPVARVRIPWETVDPAFPGGACVRFRFENVRLPADPKANVELVHEMRRASRDAQGEYPLPAGANVRLVVDGCGLERQLVLALPAGSVANVPVHRLEVDDLVLTPPGEAPRKVRARTTIARKIPGGWAPVTGSAETPMGLDVLDGTYRVRTEAPGVPTQEQELTFP